MKDSFRYDLHFLVGWVLFLIFCTKYRSKLFMFSWITTQLMCKHTAYVSYFFVFTRLSPEGSNCHEIKLIYIG